MMLWSRESKVNQEGKKRRLGSCSPQEKQRERGKKEVRDAQGKNGIGRLNKLRDGDPN